MLLAQTSLGIQQAMPLLGHWDHDHSVTEHRKQSKSITSKENAKLLLSREIKKLFSSLRLTHLCEDISKFFSLLLGTNMSTKLKKIKSYYTLVKDPRTAIIALLT